MTARSTLSRRDFLARSAAVTGGLVIGFHFSGVARAIVQDSKPTPAPNPNAFLRIAPDDSVTVFLKHSEMGQGVGTSLPMVVAEELECDWTKVRFEHGLADDAYAHNFFHAQMTGGSTSTWESFDQMRGAGAAAREMLIAAAAARWGVPAAECKAEAGVVTHGEKHKARYGELAADANKLPVPAKPRLKDPKDWKLIGRPTHRLDSAAKVSGRAEFGIDVKRPGMLVAVVARAPVFGATLKGFRAEKAKAVPGVVDVIQIPSGVGVVAEHFWAARLGRDALEVDWNEGSFAGHSTAAQLAAYKAQAGSPGAVAASKGDVDANLAKAAKVIEAEYHLPYLAHATMEPMNATAEVRADSCEVWTGTQFQTADQAAAAKIAGLEPKQVTLHTTFLGGGFGRRATPNSDFVSEAVHLSKATKKPVKVVWTREDDTRGGYYRPMWLSRIRAALDGEGKPVAWAHTIVGQSILAGTPFGSMIKNGIDDTSVEGAADSPYLEGIANHRVDLHTTKLPVPVLWWRSVGHTHTAFVIETFVDELAAGAGKDPVAYRRELLPEGSRHRRTLDAAADAFGWGKPLPAGHAAGIAVHESFKSVVAHAAEVSIEGGRIRVHRVASAIDCGPVVNPDTIEAQIQGGVVFGLTAALYGQVTFKDGRVEQSNFHDYPLLRMMEMPRVDVRIIKSDEPMGGVGEPGVPPIAPAVANALFVLTKVRSRQLPFKLT
jgi:isoquinoline 1-oxidoreductase beta subunit